MKIISIDISGKVFKYDDALYDMLIKENQNHDDLLFLTPYRTICSRERYNYKLFCFIPQHKASSSNPIKRITKALEVFINYLYLAKIIKIEKPDVLHLQWLPFLDICNIEYFFLKHFKKINKNIKIILTVHNIYPHNFSEDKRKSYKNRLINIKRFIDSFIVHTQNSAEELTQEYEIDYNDINIIKHGVFIPQTYPSKSRTDNNRCRLLMFGFQSFYKGTDLLIQSVEKLPENIKNKIEIRIIGAVSKDLQHLLSEHKGYVYWNNSYISDDELNQEITNADVLIYPYRKISQSGALLLGLSFNKPMIVANLPSFIETLNGYPTEMFFESGNIDSLKDVICNYVLFENLLIQKVHNCIEKIKYENSWEKSSRDTLELYRKIIEDNI